MAMLFRRLGALGRHESFVVATLRSRYLSGLSTVNISTISEHVPTWATVNPVEMCQAVPAIGANLVNGEWVQTARNKNLIDPLNGENFAVVPDTTSQELEPFVLSAATCPKAGLHNPLSNSERYKLYGEVTSKMAAELAKPEVTNYFAQLIQRVVPKHNQQCLNEVNTVLQWLQSFSGDSIRQLGRSFAVPGAHFMSESRGYRWPYGSVAVITPFNFPLEIPSIQTMSALFMGNRPLVKVDDKVSIVMEQFVRFAIDCGMPANDVDLLYSDGLVANELLLRTNPRMTMFTGSQGVAEKLCADLKGRIKLEDAGFNWKILGPDIRDDIYEYVVWQSDEDAYGYSGQKCSAQSILFVHDKWESKGFIDDIGKRASLRCLDDLTISPVLSVSNTTMSNHVASLLKIKGSKLLFGGPLESHTIPDVYGSYKPTAVFVPLAEILKPENYDLVTTEIFGPVQIVTTYNDESMGSVYDALERMPSNLTGSVVSANANFLQNILSRTVNGTTYTGLRARTTGAPANHWFGPAGDPRGGGIHTIEAIQQTWSCHREIVLDGWGLQESDTFSDQGPAWTVPPPT
eukprot:m.186797 g.186797  ORF g.186797 m.186797 type:complete len:574 (-) comp32282_c1_seq1:512-2233(-)